MTQEMYGAQGRIGNKTYYRAPSGATVARTVVTPKNPKTQAQTYQRVIAKQVSACYAKMKEICDHSFEGVTMGAESMNRFRKLNLVTLRNRAAEIQSAGISLAEFYQFQPIGSEKFVPAAVIISEGSLPKVKAGIDNQTSAMTLVASANTYRAIINDWGLHRGDQLTFVAVTKDSDGDYNFKYSRVILDPRNADGSGASLDSAFATDGHIVNLPNARNKGNLTVEFANGKFYITLDEDPMAAAGIIVSRKAGDYNFRSNCKLVLDETVIGNDLCGLETAVQLSYTTSELYVENDAYLNNSGTGGGEGISSGAASSDPDAPSFTSNAIINGASQNVNGTTSVSSLTSLVVNGRNLTEENVYAMVGSERKTATINAAKTQATFTWAQSPAVGTTVAVHGVNAEGTDSVLFNVAIIQPSSGGNGEGLGG